MFYWKHSLPVSEKKKVPDFSVDFGTSWADTSEIWSYFDIQTWYKNCANILDQFLYLYSLIFLQHLLRSCLPYVWSSLWATSRPLTSCISPLLAICSPAWPFFGQRPNVDWLDTCLSKLSAESPHRLLKLWIYLLHISQHHARYSRQEPAIHRGTMNSCFSPVT